MDSTTKMYLLLLIPPTSRFLRLEFQVQYAAVNRGAKCRISAKCVGFVACYGVLEGLIRVLVGSYQESRSGPLEVEKDCEIFRCKRCVGTPGKKIVLI